MIKINPKTPTREQQLKDDPNTPLWLARLISSLESQDIASLNQLIADTSTLLSILNDRKEQLIEDNPFCSSATTPDYFGAYKYLVADIYKSERACAVEKSIVDKLDFNNLEDLATEYHALSMRYAQYLVAIGAAFSIEESMEDFERYLVPKLRPGVE